MYAVPHAHTCVLTPPLQPLPQPVPFQPLDQLLRSDRSDDQTTPPTTTTRATTTTTTTRTLPRLQQARSRPHPQRLQTYPACDDPLFRDHSAASAHRPVPHLPAPRDRRPDRWPLPDPHPPPRRPPLRPPAAPSPRALFPCSPLCLGPWPAVGRKPLNNLWLPTEGLRQGHGPVAGARKWANARVPLTQFLYCSA